MTLFKDTDKKAQEIFEKNCNPVITTLVGSVFGMVATKLISTAKGSIDYKCFEHFLVKQIQEYAIDKCDAKKIAADIIKSNICPVDGIFNWKVTSSKYLDIFDDTFDNCTSKGNYNFCDKIMELNLEGKENETISLGKQISTIFKSNLVCGLVSFVSFANLGFSAYKFHKISQLTETVAGKNYEKQLKDIKTKFRDHLNELDLTGDCNHFLAKINYVKNNIENDLKDLENLIVNIEADIKLYKKEKKESIASLAVSIIFGGSAAVGSFVATGGISTGFYIASLVSNIMSGTVNAVNIKNCISSIEELERIKKEAEEEKKIMEQKIDELKLKGKQKELSFPDYYKQFEEITQKQNEEAQKYILNGNYF